MNRSLRLYSFVPVFFFLSALLHSQPDIDHAYLGVHTSRLDRAVSHQLGLPNGLHLLVERVAEGSPAEYAGLQLHDILLKFDDQFLVNPEQLKTLVRMRNPGERVNLSILRQSKPLSLSVELIEAPEDLRDLDDSDWFEDRDGLGLDRFFGPNDRLRDLLRRHSFDFPEIRQFHNRPFFSSPRGQATQPHNLLDDPLHGGGTDVQSHSYSSSTQQITVNDEEGSLQWTEKDGLRFLRATDLEGKVVFDGSISSEEDLENLPERVGERLRAMQDSGQIPRD
jgi:hypothetical protein